MLLEFLGYRTSNRRVTEFQNHHQNSSYSNTVSFCVSFCVYSIFLSQNPTTAIMSFLGHTMGLFPYDSMTTAVVLLGTCFWYQGKARRKYLMFKAILSCTEVPKALVKFVLRRSQGHATDLMEDATNPVAPVSGYFVDMRFAKPFLDKAKFEKHFLDMVVEAGAQKEWGEVLWPETKTIAGGISDEIVPRCAEIPTLQELSHAPKYGKTFSICVVNGDPALGTDSMLRCQLPVATTFDGTSCFNFMKELISRYYGTANPEVFTAAKKLRLSEDAKAKFKANSPWTIARFFKVWYGVYQNCDHWAWQIATLPNFLEGFGKYGTPPQFWTDENGKQRNEYRKLICNWDEKESTAMIAAFKKNGMKPYSGMAYTAIKAFEMTFNELPVGMMQQASLQIRGYVPHYSERNLCGDWLIGPIHRIPRSKTTYEFQDAVDMRKELHANLLNHTGNVLEAFESRAYGTFQAGVQQYQMCTPQDVSGCFWGGCCVLLLDARSNSFFLFPFFLADPSI